MHTPISPRIRLSASLALIGLLALTACASPSGVEPAATDAVASASTSPAPEGPALECEERGYPCSMAEVPSEIVERTMDLGDAASDRIAAGEPIDDVAATLRAEPDMAEVAVDGDTLRYRLADGRPAWLTSAPEGPAPEAFDGINARLATYFDVAGTEDPRKRAAILSPYKFLAGDVDAGARVADLLRATRGYASGVTYAENLGLGDTEVSVDDFAALDGNAVIHIQSGSTHVCTAGAEADRLVTSPLDGPCWGAILAHPIAEVDGMVPDQPHVGVDLVKYAGSGWHLAVNGDFFSAQYGDGIDDAIIVLNMPELEGTGLPRRIAGATSDVLYWDFWRPAGLASEATLSLLGQLAESGRTVSAVVGEMGDGLRIGDARLVALPPESGASNRIREVIHLRDRSSGSPLDEVGSVTVATELGDGENDLVPFMVDVEGLTPDEAAATTVNVLFDNWQVAQQASEGQQIGDGIWRLEGLADIGDLTEGQMLEIQAYVQLPEGGLSRDSASVRVEGASVGRVWAGTITSVMPVGEGTIETRTAEVEFTRDPAAPDTGWVYFYITKGSLTWQMSGSDSACSYSGYAEGLPLDQTEFNYLVFDVSEDSIKYWATGNNSDGPLAEVSASCDDGRTFTYGTGADGVWWSIPSNAPLVVEGDTLSGEREDPITGATWSWELHKVGD